MTYLSAYPFFRSQWANVMYNDEDPMIVSSRDRAFSGEWKAVVSELTGSTFLISRYMGQHKFFVMRGQVFL